MDDERDDALPRLYDGARRRCTPPHAAAVAQRLLSKAPMMTTNDNAFSTAKVVFAVGRTLLLGRLLWGEDSAVEISGLPPVVGAPPPNVARAVAFLCREGLATVDDEARVGLTDHGVYELAGPAGSRHSGRPERAAPLVSPRDTGDRGPGRSD